MNRASLGEKDAPMGNSSRLFGRQDDIWNVAVYGGGSTFFAARHGRTERRVEHVEHVEQAERYGVLRIDRSANVDLLPPIFVSVDAVKTGLAGDSSV
jgi:hypothetical protein